MAAIYQWFEENQTLLTTTLYPVETVEALQISGEVSGGALIAIPVEDIEGSADIVNMTYIQQRWFYEDGPYDDGIQGDADIVNMTYVQQRWFITDGPYDESIEGSADVVNITNVNKRVEADTPDESLQIGFEIANTSSMTAV